MKQIESIKWAVLFTDIKNFTLKSSLLTQKQIEDLLNKLNDLIFPIITKYDWEIVKSLWDSYMIIFSSVEKSIYTSINIQNILLEYNSNIKFDLFKIELRITIDYWVLEKKFTIKWNDYFWETVNLASRLQSITDANKIYITWNVYDEIKNIKNIKIVSLWKTSFKWILFNPNIYSIIFNENDTINNEKKENSFMITDDVSDSIKNIDSTIFKFASVAAVLWIQPVPFLDVYAILPLHLYLLNQIAKEYWIKLNKSDSKEIITTVMWSVSGSYLLSQWVVWISKIWLLWFWWYLMISLNFALTYAIWKILSYYLYKKSRWIKSTNKELNNLFKYSITNWKNIAKKDKNKIIIIWKEYRDTFLKFINKNNINLNFLKNKK